MRPLPLTRTVQAALVASAYALPLAVAPTLVQDAAGLPKDAALALATAILIGCGVARRVVFGEPVAPAFPLAAPLLGWLSWAALSLVHTTAPAEGALRLAYFGALATVAVMAASLPGRDRLADALGIAGGLTAVYGIGQYFGFELIEWSSHFRPRVFSTLGNPVFLGGYLAALFPVAFARWLATEREETKDLLTLLLAALGLAAFLTWTRSSWFAILAATAVQFTVLGLTARGRAQLDANRTWLASGAAVALIAGFLVSSAQVGGRPAVPVGDRLRDAVNPHGYSLRFRLVTTEVGARIAREFPVLGGGLGSYGARYPALRLATRTARTSKDVFFASQEAYAHNDHAHLLAETGVVGLGLWWWLLATAVRWGWSRARSGDWHGLGVIGCVTAVAVDGAGNFPLLTEPTAWVLFAALGLLAAPAVTAAADPLPPRFRGLAWAGAAIPLACGLAALPPVYHRLWADRQQMEGDRQVSYNNYEMASVYYGAGVRANPSNKFLNFRYSVAAMSLGRFEWQGTALDDSILYARRALALGYEDENVYKHLSTLFERKGAIPQAIRALDRAYALNPRREDIANNLSYFLAESGTRLEEAVALGRAAVAQVPSDPRYLDTLGWALHRVGRDTEAAATLRRALALLPPNPKDGGRTAARAEVQAHLDAARRGRG